MKKSCGCNQLHGVINRYDAPAITAAPETSTTKKLIGYAGIALIAYYLIKFYKN